MFKDNLVTITLMLFGAAGILGSFLFSCVYDNTDIIYPCIDHIDRCCHALPETGIEIYMDNDIDLYAVGYGCNGI